MSKDRGNVSRLKPSVFVEDDQPCKSPDTLAQYDAVLRECRALLAAKNADYGDSWRLMRFTSIVDQIKVKICRIDQLAYGHAPQASEGIDSELRDILNYAAFALILRGEAGEP